MDFVFCGVGDVPFLKLGSELVAEFGTITEHIQAKVRPWNYIIMIKCPLIMGDILFKAQCH